MVDPSGSDRYAGVYVTNQRLIVVARSKTMAGVLLDRDPVVLPLDAGFAELGGALARALAASAVVLPHPRQADWAGAEKPLLKAAGVRSWKAFMAGAGLVSVRDDGDRLALTPQINKGRWFEPNDERTGLSRDFDVAAEAAIQLLLPSRG